MNTSKRLPPWHEHFRLPNGRQMLIRPIRPEDAEPVREGFSLLYPEQIRRRFLQTLSELTPQMAQRLCSPSAKTEFALVAAETLPPGEALVGAVARASTLPDSRDGEFCILVSRFLAGQGVGRHLMGRVVKWAQRKRLEQLHGELAENNPPMLQLAHAMGFRTPSAESSDGLVRVVLQLPR